MKKCPKCGTVLDDSKKTCYMCGTVLSKKSPMNFGDTFDSQIGATVSKSQDNVFNNLSDLNTNNNLTSTFVSPVDNNSASKTSKAANVFASQVDNLNAQQYDERTALEKIFTSDSRFKSKDELNEIEKNLKTSAQISNNKPVRTPAQSQPVATKQAYVNQSQSPNYQNNINNSTPSNYNSSKAPINWGSNLNDNQKKKFNISLSFIFNTTCFILFIGAMLYLYFNYIKPKPNESVELGGLIYTLDPSFNLKTDDNFSKYYTKGENCAIRISYGTTNNVDDFVDTYFDSIRAEYQNQEGYNTNVEALQINGNTWYELNVISLKENPASSGGYSPATKFKYVAMVYKGTYYDIRYVNQDDDGTCSEAYDNFINSLSFIQED